MQLLMGWMIKNKPLSMCRTELVCEIMRHESVIYGPHVRHLRHTCGVLREVRDCNESVYIQWDLPPSCSNTAWHLVSTLRPGSGKFRASVKRRQWLRSLFSCDLNHCFLKYTYTYSFMWGLHVIPYCIIKLDRQKRGNYIFTDSLLWLNRFKLKCYVD